MKTFRLFGLLLTAVLLSCNLASCSDDDDEGGKPNLETPAFESESAKYEITSAGSAYKSIELTASGNYIITEANSYYAAPPLAVKKQNKRALLATKGTCFLGNGSRASRASSSNGIIYGKYEKVGEMEYNLIGFGTVKIESTASNALSLTITEEGDTPYTLTAARSNNTSSSEKTNALCRTWNMETIQIVYKVNGKTYFNETAKMDPASLNKLVGKLSDFFDEPLTVEEFFDDELPEQVVFTKSGTYMVYYSSQSLAVSTWAWENESKGILRYSWNYEDIYDEYYSGTVDISFSGSTLKISESEIEEEDGDTYEGYVAYTLSEVK